MILPPPYPSFGECIRFLARGMDTKAGDRHVDRLAREGDFDWAILDGVIDRLLIEGVSGILLGEPLNAYVAWVKRGREVYQHALLGTPLDGVGRADVADIFSEHLWCPLAAELLAGLESACPGPGLTQLLGSDQHSIDLVFEWADELSASDCVKLIYPGSTGDDKRERDKIAKWRTGKDLPSTQSLKLLASRVRSSGAPWAFADKLITWLFVAATISRAEQDTRFPVRSGLLRALIGPALSLDDLNLHLQSAVHKQGQQQEELSQIGAQLWRDLRRSTPKLPGDQAATDARIEQFIALMKRVDPEQRTAYHCAWMRARWHVLSGEYEECLEHYERAISLAAYRAGHQVKDLVAEALCLEAFVGRKKAFLKQLKHLGISLGLLKRPLTQDVVEEWENEQLARQLFELFPPQGRFPEVNLDLSKTPVPGLMLISPEQVERIVVDRRKPDRVRAVRFADGTVRCWPQLRLFASFGFHAKVRELLDIGAPVDQLDSHGGSALLCAIQHATDTGHRQTLDLLLQFAHADQTLNARTARKRLSPLMCAVEFGQPDVVQALLKMGALPDLEATTDDKTPLYRVISIAWGLRHPSRMAEMLASGMSQQPDEELKDALRRHGVMSVGVFGDQTTAWKEHPQLAIETISAMVNVMNRRHSSQRLLSIAQALLEQGAKPNKPHRYPVKGYTPLMLAVESDLPEFVHALLQHGGDPLRPDASGRDCFQIAMESRAIRAVQVLRSYR